MPARARAGIAVAGAAVRNAGIVNTATAQGMAEPKRIGILVDDGVLLLNVAGPTEVFNAANHESRGRGGPLLYRVELLSPSGGLLRASSGIEIMTAPLPDPARVRYHTIAVAGGMRNDAMIRNADTLVWLRRMSEDAERVASIGGGAFLLAQAGLLNMRRCVTHWLYRENLQASYPGIRVDPEALFVADGKLYSTAGSSAGIDLAIQMLEEDFGRRIAIDVARVLMVARRRSGEQPQISAELKAQAASLPRIASAAEWIVANLDTPLRVSDIAGRFAMSERNFSRAFKKELSITPQQFIALTRIEAARRWLVETRLPIDKIARRCGFSSAEQMNQSFRRVMACSPSDYREANRPAGAVGQA